MGSLKESYLVSMLSNKCPRCRKGNIYTSKSAYQFRQILVMNKECPVCNQPTEIEVGFYYGTGYVSYALSVGFSLATLIAWWFTIGFSLDDNRFFWWMGINAAVMLAMQPLFMRLSRTLWLSWFVSYDPNWKEHPIEAPERNIEGQENNW